MTLEFASPHRPAGSLGRVVTAAPVTHSDRARLTATARAVAAAAVAVVAVVDIALGLDLESLRPGA